MKLIVIGEFELGEDLIYRIDMIKLGAVVKLTSRFRYAFPRGYCALTPPNFGQRCAGIVL